MNSNRRDAKTEISMLPAFFASLRLCVFALTLFFCFSLPAAAQDQPLDPLAVPTYGIAAGGVGFSPDPFRVAAVTGSGSIDANTRNLGSSECVGRITAQPTFRFTALTRFNRLRFIYVADAVTEDAALIIRDPGGVYHCNDNSSGVRNPTVQIDGAPSGDYNVWVGAVSDRIFGDLYVTTRADVIPGSLELIVPRLTPTPLIAPTPTPIPADALNPTLPAATDDLVAGFLPDPYWRVLIGGGALDVTRSVSAADCFGFTASPPNFRLNWSGNSTRLRWLFAPLNQGQDAALIVQAPDGSWHCNRDFAPGYAQPQVDFVNPAAGMYSVWVSDETAPDESVIGLLYVTEKQYSPETIPAAGTAPLGLTLAGLTPESSAFVFDATAPDPYAIPGALAGGDVDIGAQTIACPGSYTDLPSFGFRLAQPTPDLRVFFVARDPQADAALIVRMPDGTWYCNDNSFHTQQPTIDVIGSRATGGVSVWIGSITPGESIPGTLYLTRGSASPLDPTRRAPLIEK